MGALQSHSTPWASVSCGLQSPGRTGGGQDLVFVKVGPGFYLAISRVGSKDTSDSSYGADERAGACPVEREVAHLGTHTAGRSDVICFHWIAERRAVAWRGLGREEQELHSRPCPLWNLDLQVSVMAFGDPCCPLLLEGCSPVIGTHLTCQVLSSTGSAVEVQHGNLDLARAIRSFSSTPCFCWMGT